MMGYFILIVIYSKVKLSCFILNITVNTNLTIYGDHACLFDYRAPTISDGDMISYMQYHYIMEMELSDVATTNFYLQHYHDSSMTTVLYVLFQRINHLKTQKYYALRVQQGVNYGNIYYLGKETCYSSCWAGREKMYSKHHQINPKSNKSLTQALVNTFKNAQNVVCYNSNITKIKLWTFPNGNLFISIIKFKNSSQLYVPILQLDNIYIFLNSVYVPYISGNIPIEYSHLSNIMSYAMKNKNITLYDINLFEYFYDPTLQDTYTYMLIFKNSTTNKFKKVVGNFRLNGDLFYRNQIYYNDCENESRLLLQKSYLNSSQKILKIPKFSTTDHSQIQTILKQIGKRPLIYSWQFFEFPNYHREYFINFNNLTQNKLYQIYYCTFNKQMTKRQLTGHSISKNPRDRLAQIPILKQYFQQFRLQTLNFTYPFSYCDFYQFCSFQRLQFQILICLTQSKSNYTKNMYLEKQCYDAVIFFKDLKTNRITLYGKSTINCTYCDFYGNIPKPRSYCYQIIPSMMQTESFENLYDKNIDSFNNYQISDFYQGMTIKSKSLRLPTINIIKFIRNGIISAFYIYYYEQQGLTIFDEYIEKYDVKNK